MELDDLSRFITRIVFSSIFELAQSCRAVSSQIGVLGSLPTATKPLSLIHTDVPQTVQLQTNQGTLHSHDAELLGLNLG